jgi:ADP-heptose:LPS heptosyltransferase
MKLPADIQKIIIFRALQLGDMLCLVPAMRAIRKAYPNAKIILAGLPWAISFTERFSRYFDGFISFPGYPGLPEQPVDAKAFVKFLADVQTQQFDLALQMQGNGYLVNPMIELFGAKYTAGFCKPGDYCPNRDYFLEYPAYGHEIARHLRLMNFVGIYSDGTYLEFPLTADDQSDFNKLNLPLANQRYVCIHPGSRGNWRQWPIENFAAIADVCKKSGFDVVLTGTGDEAEIIEKVSSLMKYKAINTAGKTNLGSAGVLIKNAALLVSNCTGVSHIASALKTKSIVISMDGEPERWAPLDQQLHYTINWLKDPNYEKVSRQLTKFLNPVN